jgi:hypothetical protein
MIKKKEYIKEEQMKIKTLILIILSSMLVLGAKGCEENAELNSIETKGAEGEETDADIPAIGADGGKINTKDDLLKVMPELQEHSRKFDIKRYYNLIVLTTYDNLNFQEAVNKLRNETSMNIPVCILCLIMGHTLIQKVNLNGNAYR